VLFRSPTPLEIPGARYLEAVVNSMPLEIPGARCVEAVLGPRVGLDMGQKRVVLA
jgi:hypothetical protein